MCMTRSNLFVEIPVFTNDTSNRFAEPVGSGFNVVCNFVANGWKSVVRFEGDLPYGEEIYRIVEFLRTDREQVEDISLTNISKFLLSQKCPCTSTLPRPCCSSAPMAELLGINRRVKLDDTVNIG